MPLASCERCGKMYDKSGAFSVCPKCLPKEEADYETVRDVLLGNPNLTAEQVSSETGVDIKCVMRLVQGGRINHVNPNEIIKCGKCGARAISLSKRLCEACLNELNQQLAREQSRIKLPKRKDVELGKALNVPESQSVRKSRALEFRNRD